MPLKSFDDGVQCVSLQISYF